MKLLGTFSFMIITTALLSSALKAEVLGVGECLTCEYKTIQSAIDAAANGDVVSIEDGTYVEELTVAGKDIFITGNSLDTDAVVIQGAIVFESDTINELQYVLVESAAVDTGTGVLIKGALDLKDAHVSGFATGVRASKGALLDMNSTEIIKCKNGLKVKRKADVNIDDSLFADNSNNGIKVLKVPSDFRINESVIANSKKGNFL